jgi:hypothetical protein
VKLKTYDIIHFFEGFITAFLSLYFTIQSLVLTALFILYELDEELHLSDEAYRDIFFYAIGYGIFLFFVCVFF